MVATRVRDLSEADWYRLVACAKGQVEPDLVVRGGTVLNVYAGELMQADVHVIDGRIAYVGTRPYTGEQARVLDATDRVLVPGYIEPHAHPFQFYNPITYAESVLARGTTCSVNDNLMLTLNLEFGQFGRFVESMSTLPIKMAWWIRLDPQAHLPEKAYKFNGQLLGRLLKNPYMWQAGEVTDWKSWIDGDEEMVQAALQAKEFRKRIEGHCAGVSHDTLNVLTAAGITADHEAINAEDALRRLRLGLWTTLRHSSLRPDLPAILPELIPRLRNWNRVMMTTDGPTPLYLQQGYTDHLIRTAIAQGLDPITAYQLVTINPATYYGVDDQIGGIAPGRIADFLILADLLEPTPLVVIADGRVVAEQGQLVERLTAPSWPDAGLMPLQPIGTIEPDWFTVHTDASHFPVMNLTNPAIARRVDLPVEPIAGRLDGVVEGSDDLCYVSLLHREGQWVCNGLLRGFATTLAGLASSFTGAGELVVIGRNRAAMAVATERMLALGGGIVIVDDEGQVLFELPLRIAGAMGEQSVDELGAASSRLADVLRAQGHTHYDPIYTLLFLSSTHLPELRLSSAGLFEVKTKRILHPARRLVKASEML